MKPTTSNDNPIIIIDDDTDDLEIFQEGFKQLGIPNEILTFTDGHKFYDYITTTDKKSFFILCDINMQLLNGFELKKQIFDNEELRLKCTPFLMMSTSGASKSVLAAYSLNVQGYFIKPGSISELKDLFDVIVNYWSISQRPLSEQ
jgi:CheY-like chemotaxis protein